MVHPRSLKLVCRKDAKLEPFIPVLFYTGFLYRDILAFVDCSQYILPVDSLTPDGKKYLVVTHRNLHKITMSVMCDA